MLYMVYHSSQDQYLKGCFIRKSACVFTIRIFSNASTLKPEIAELNPVLTERYIRYKKHEHSHIHMNKYEKYVSLFRIYVSKFYKIEKVDLYTIIWRKVILKILK